MLTCLHERAALSGEFRENWSLEGSRNLRRAGNVCVRDNARSRQDGDLAHMIWNVPEIIAQLSKQYELYSGDVIFTGTPAGVGPLRPGDEIKCSIERLGVFGIRIGQPD